MGEFATSFMKRYTHWPQAYLGLAFGWAVPMSFAAETGAVPWIAWQIYAATILWALVYDTMYAMVDRDDDLRIGVKSTAILFGENDRLILGILQVAMLGILFGVGLQADLGGAYFLALGVAGACSGYQQWLIRNREKAGCFAAFLNNNRFGAAVFAGIAVDYLMR